MDFLPEVKMDFIPSDDESVVEETIEENIDDFNAEKDISQEEITESEIEKVVPKAKSKREDMKVEDIFNLPNKDGVIINDPNVKLTKKGKPRKPRPPMSEAHKEKLKIAREKAMASRKKKAQEKKDAKALEKEEKELLKKQKVKRVQKLKQEVEEDEPPKEIKREPTFTKKDLEEAQLQAIMNYEKIRKSRKEEKRIQQEKNREQEALKAQLRRAVAPPKQEYNNPFAGCY
tara:strand:- start:285 stop:977 length:693 start_codon:yes stop_codon:yes gene_type:complete